MDEYYKDGKILIYNYDQLKQIGSDAFVYTKDKEGNIGTGDIVVNEGTQLTYGKDAQYLLMNEIKMDTKSIWNVRDDFTGKIEGEAIKEDETPTLYDKKTDTIYIYNPYQLMVLEQEDSDKEPVMSLDYDAPKFGMGQMIYPNGEDKDHLTYSKDHNYVISKNFSSDKPELVADQLSINPATTDTEGRDFKGQVVKTIGDKTYILIGNEKQLRAIGTNKAVQGAVYQAYLELGKWKIDKDSSGNSIMLYGGDADLTKEQNGIKDFTFGEVSDTDKKLSSVSSFHTRGKCGVDQKTGKVDPSLDIKDQTNQKYTKNANYIIFRDIDLGSSDWTPLTFQGTMIGAKSAEKGGLWKDSVINTIDKPVISNATVNQSTKINVGEQMGVGFFSTISSEVSEKDIGLSKGLVKVSNIQFDNLKVHTTTNETYYPPSLVSTLTNTLGKLLGGLLSGLTFILTFGQVKIDLGKTLGDVLDARKKDPTALSTGAIAGRVEGQVEISNIEVNNANVKNVNGYTGGFVGYAVGSTQYDGLSNALGDLVKLLTNILNVIPGLGLGDLIKILLGNAIPLGKLIPTGYINPKIVNCNINSLTIYTASDKKYAGGFIGMQKGAIVESCSVSDGTNTISGKNFVGGFVGLARDDVIKGTLSGALDIETKLPKMNTESLLLNCSLNNAVQSVSGESYIGGFAGGMANASTVNCSITSNALTVTASGNYAGGFAGIASLGWAADLGKGDTKDDLLGGVVDLVVKLLSSNPGATSSLLSLAGVNPSHILGCSVNTSLTVSGKDYVGGITGRGNGAYIAQSNADNLQKISYWKNNVYDIGSVSVLGVSLTGLSNIKGNDYVGGIAGSMGTASVAGLLNTTLGVASYLAFTVDNVYISGNDLRIEGNERVGGGLGDALGGSIKTVKIDNLNSAEGNNYVGGFIGLSGPGDLAGTDGGLTVNLLGLNYVLKLNNLLSLGQAIEVKIDDVNVNGTTDGFTVHAKGSRDSNSVLDYSASGFIAKSGSTKVENSHVTNLKSVKAADDGGYASGFVAISKTGGLADVADDNSIKSLIEANGLVNAVGYLIPKYTNCTVSFVNGGSVTADVAGGFAADFQSGTVDTWNSWVEYVGKYGGYGSDLAQNGKVDSPDKLNEITGQYVYGYNVVAGRSNYRDETILSNGGAAGGYVGSMLTGTITNGQAHDTKLVKGLRCAGGFAGEMINGGAANLGGTSILGLNLELGQMLKVLNVFVPVIKQSSVEGYQSGLNVQSTGVNDDKELLGYAGGYVGKLIGGQIWGDDTLRCKVTNLRRVDGTSYVGGFVGSSRPGSVATVDPVRGEGLLSKLLGTLLNTPTDLIKVLNATVATIRYADVEAWNDWGVIVNGAYDSGGNNTSYAKAAGGFAGMLEGTVLGKKDVAQAGVTVQNIRSVASGEYAGGCFGIADVAGVANISAGSETSLLDKLLKLGRVDVLDAFRSYVYYGNVSGSKDAGLSVSANIAKKYGQNNEVTYSGTAGGFGGSLLNGSVKNSTVTNLSNVRGLNSVGGFVGYSGKSGVVGADKIDVLGNNTGQLLGGALGVMDIFGSHIDDSKVTGIDGGYTVQSTGGEEQVAGGFIGYANLARISRCTTGAKDASFGLKQVTSDGTAGGFAGRTSYAYLADVKLDSGPANVLFAVVNRLVKALYLDKIQDSNLLKINLGLIKVEALYDGNLIHVNILGLDISVGLSKKSADNAQQTDLAIITIGDSSIKLPCDENGLLNDNDAKSNISVNLIKANRTKITDSKVYGISAGYDVYAGGADNNKDGTAKDGRSGGFVGFNDEGLLKNNDMYLCDVVRGTSNLVGPFSGQSDLNSVYEFNTQEKVEGVSNNYRIYRKLDKALDEIKKNTTKLNMEYSKDASTGWDIYTLGHMKPVEKYDDLKNAQITDSNGLVKVDLNAYESEAKAVLMSDTKTNLNTGESDTPEPSESQDPCDKNIKLTINKVWKDLNDFSKLRPNSITVTISRTWTGADNKEHTEIVPSFENCVIEGNSKSTWKKVIKGLPAYIKNGDKICYYTYSVTETKIDGYTTTIEKSKDGFTFTITNKHFPGLPDTGGNGRYLIYLIGLLLLAIYLVTGKKRNKKNQLAEKL